MPLTNVGSRRRVPSATSETGCAAAARQQDNGSVPRGATTTRASCSEHPSVQRRRHPAASGAQLRRGGMPVQSEPPAIEAWRNDADARSWARDHAVGWTFDPSRQTDYCPEHARFSTAPAADLVPPRPTSTARDRAGNPLNRDEYAERLRDRLADRARSMGPTVTAGQAEVAARLLDELAGVYRGESLGMLAHELSALLDNRFDDRG